MTHLLLTFETTDAEGYTITRRYTYKSFAPFEAAVREAVALLAGKGLIFNSLVEATDLDSVPVLE